MRVFREINLSLALFVVFCFAFPWVEVSSGDALNSESGLSLARQGTLMLWLIPLLMVIVFALGVGRDWKRRMLSFGLASVIGGVVSAILTFRPRVDSSQVAGLLAVRTTAWFWLSFASSVVIALSGLVLIIRRPPKGPVGS